MWLVITIVALLLLGIIMLVIRQPTGLLGRFRQRYRQISMEATWQSWLNDGVRNTQTSTQIGLMHTVDEDVRESVHQSLLELEDRLRRDAQPMLAIRKELMDSIDRRQLNSEILKLPVNTRADLRSSHPNILQTDVAARTYIDANDLRITVLRKYAGLRYGDCADGDWFDVYQKASRLRQRGTRGYIERACGGMQNATDDVRFKTMTLMDSEIRERLLQVPAGTRFPGFGKSAVQIGESI
ncbi:MAG TPA: hypothetical protein VNF48_05770 [Gammaproteobacteria bacterium]|nr:hypothetical protein [Gammaproteobacteria bacterium]